MASNNKRIKLDGKRFNRLFVIKYDFKYKKYLCKCTCGTEKLIQSGALRNGFTKSCGCLSSESTSKRFLKHGFASNYKIEKIYSVWTSMKQRCFNKKNPFFKQYGGRGIKVCERWMVFENFYKDMGNPKPGMSINRINNNGNYEPGNCEWTTRKIQQNNTRRNKLFTLNGISKTLAEWSDYLNIPYGRLDNRKRKGLSTIDILDTRKFNNQHKEVKNKSVKQ